VIYSALSPVLELIINRQAIYITNGFLDSEDEVLSLSLQEYAEMEDGSECKKMPEKWPIK